MTLVIKPLSSSPGVEDWTACSRGRQLLMQEHRQDRMTSVLGRLCEAGLSHSPCHTGGENHLDSTPSLDLKGDSILKCSCQNHSYVSAAFFTKEN